MHTAGSFCNDYQTCAGKVSALQSWQVATFGYFDIAYNYLIGGDGNIYEGRGAGVENAWMPSAIDICYIGNYIRNYDKVSTKMDKAGQRLIARLGIQGYLTSDYVVIGQNQTYNTQSPGDNVYEKIVHWPHYDSQLYFST
ncbi:hypothetical protein ABEB36_001236 [Hypothenemus hampei]|uniref:Peptidoglycan recognition protein family domain-containing protein n=1 Tax=Hypothenemus hampei TaxID=57062 RepID=A0ABD1FHG9_HYPHA